MSITFSSDANRKPTARPFAVPAFNTLPTDNTTSSTRRNDTLSLMTLHAVRHDIMALCC
jgi:hypothetical protein